MKVEKIKIKNIINMNCYIISRNQKAIIIDPGFNDILITKYINENNLIVIAVLLTHAHWDHIGGINLYDVPVYINKKEKLWLFNENNLLQKRAIKYNFKWLYNFEDINFIYFENNEILKIQEFEIQTFFIPGHSPGQSAYLINDYLFCGDSIFDMLISRTDLEFSNYNDQIYFVKLMLNEIKDNVIIHPGHGISSQSKNIKNDHPYFKIK